MIIKGMGVDCPGCAGDTKVVDTYWSTRDNCKQRRRKCLLCGGTFLTNELHLPGTFRKGRNVKATIRS